ncbi:MAG: isoprenyl transferase [Coriobacteriia bacterium]|nr:isoprenyl transferase [Coriobacteriia bacterium]MDO9107913.1 isoprenyl transferase [Coriobacteriia bacterium]
MTPKDQPKSEFFAAGPGSELIEQFDPERVPAHVAIIMDGNGRWAAKRGLPRLAGHRAGAKAVREAIATSIELGLEYLTIYSFSSENWARPDAEVSGLMTLFVEVLQKEMSNLSKMDVRVVVSGRREDLPSATREAFDRTERDTAHNKGLTLVVALNYGGRSELVDAVIAIAAEVASGALLPAKIDETSISSRLYTPQIPDPDLLIRTSGELRVSNFLLWQIAYTEFWVTDALWPDFDRHEMLRAIVEFQSRVRRFGGR